MDRLLVGQSWTVSEAFNPGELTPREELNLILSFLMLVLLERSRG